MRVPFFPFLAFFFLQLEKAVICTGQDAGLSASLTGIQMREENPGGHSGESASSGGQRPGKQEHQGWSMEQGLQTLDLCLFQCLDERQPGLKNQECGLGWSYYF